MVVTDHVTQSDHALELIHTMVLFSKMMRCSGVRLLSSWKVTIVRWNFTDMLKNLLSSWVTGKNHIALHSIMNTINAEPEGWSELALVVLMAPKRDVSVQVQVCEVCYLPTAVCPALALNLFFFQQQYAQHLLWLSHCRAAVSRAKTDHFARSSI